MGCRSEAATCFRWWNGGGMVSIAKWLKHPTHKWKIRKFNSIGCMPMGPSNKSILIILTS